MATGHWPAFWGERMKYSCVLCLIFLLFCGCSLRNYYFTDVRIFKKTPIYKLAKAVNNQQEDEIRKFVRAHPDIIYAEEPYNHYTILHWAIGMEKYESVRVLLEEGYNPNVVRSFNNETPLHIASGYSFIDTEAKNDSKYIKLLLDFGADANIASYYKDSTVKKKYVSALDGSTPLMNACETLTSNIEEVKILVEEGHADINTKDEIGRNAAVIALENKDVKSAYYLIVEKHSDITQGFYFLPSVILEGETNTIRYPVNLLRNWWIYPLDSEEYKIKMEIVKEFERQGVDYSATPIPDWVLEKIKRQYPDTWEEYIKVY